MSQGAAVKCTVCGAFTSVRRDAVNQTCDFCGARFVYQATHAASGAAEQRLRERTEAIQHELDALDAEAKRRAAAGDLRGAHQYAWESVRRVGVLYEETGYYHVMGCDTPDLVERNLGLAFSMHLTRLGIPRAPAQAAPAQAAPASTTSATPPGYDQMVHGLQTQDFEAAMTGYTAVCRASIDEDPRWAHQGPHEREQAVASAIRSFALSLPWATAEDLARHGIEAPTPTRRPDAPEGRYAGASRRSDGSASVPCTQCGAEVVLAHLAESVQCPYCSATFRIRLTGVDMYHARGHLEVTKNDVEEQQRLLAVAGGDLDARVASARELIAGQAPPGSDRERELTFAYTLQMGAPLDAGKQARLASSLTLGTPRTCGSCSSAIALAPGGRTCPICQERA